MTLKLIRTDYRDDGVFSVLCKENGEQVAVCLEHAYDSKNGNGSYTAKVKPGTYKCVRGMHRLGINKPKFETFEVTGVKGHSGILLHVGNYNKDSDGCILTGASYGGEPRMIYNSRVTFARLMNLLFGLNEFTLIVE